MKLSRIAVVAVMASTMLVGCGNKYLQSSAFGEMLNGAADMAMPIKVNDTFSVTKVVQAGPVSHVSVDLAKNATGNIDKYLSRDLQGKLADNAMCLLPEMRSAKHTVVLKVYQGGKHLKTVNTSSRFLCGK